MLWCGVLGKGLAKLLRHPSCGRHREEIHTGEVFAVVAKEGPPGLVPSLGIRTPWKAA